MKYTYSKMIKDFDCNPEDIICCICPSIRKCHFEVDKDVKDLLSGKTTATKKFFKNGKPWYAKLKYSEDFTKLDFIFETKK